MLVHAFGKAGRSGPLLPYVAICFATHGQGQRDNIVQIHFLSLALDKQARFEVERQKNRFHSQHGQQFHSQNIDSHSED